ncbi:N-6 DNA methylase, partial [Pedobacter sp.]|uniref:N-6 DNA methylase n=1 Tax=Pedobacter sp. TaxID=1411316 RepID=UPI002D14B47A
MSYNQLEKLQDNIRALELVFQHDGNRVLTHDEVTSIQRYSGFGGLKAILYPNGSIEQWKENGATNQDLTLYPSMMKFHQLLGQYFTPNEYTEVIDSLRSSVLTSFYTPPVIPKVLFETLKSFEVGPTSFYEPSAGMGVFVKEAINMFPTLKEVNAVEKDLLTGGVLTTLSTSWKLDSTIRLMGFEETGKEEDGKYDLIASSIPFGDVSIYDPSYEKTYTKRIHNYFFAKGIDKLVEGGVLAYITTDGFLNSPGNEENRRHLFEHADFISLVVMPENLMKDTGNTLAPNHLLIVQKNSQKSSISIEEEQLIKTVDKPSSLGVITLNQYIDQHQEILIGDEIGPGKNQYGKAHLKVLQNGNLDQMAPKIKSILEKDMVKNYKVRKVGVPYIELSSDEVPIEKYLTFLDQPIEKVRDNAMQLGLFDMNSSGDNNRALDYLNEKDELLVRKNSARLLGVIKTKEHPNHESVVVIAARELKKNYYVYRIYSNLAEINSSTQWMNSNSLQSALEDIAKVLRAYPYQYRLEGDVATKLGRLLEVKQKSDGEIRFPSDLLKPYYKEGTLIIYSGLVGVLNNVDLKKSSAKFLPLSVQDDFAFYSSYVSTRDAYVDLENYEQQTGNANIELRGLANQNYDLFLGTYGVFNLPQNKKLLLGDKAFGADMPSLLERRVGLDFIKSDFLSVGLIVPKEEFNTENYIDALSRCLNDKGFVELSFIAAATKSTELEVVQSLGDQIFTNPATREWETKDKYLSGNVVQKLEEAQRALA